MLSSLANVLVIVDTLSDASAAQLSDKCHITWINSYIRPIHAWYCLPQICWSYTAGIILTLLWTDNPKSFQGFSSTGCCGDERPQVEQNTVPSLLNSTTTEPEFFIRIDFSNRLSFQVSHHCATLRGAAEFFISMIGCFLSKPGRHS